MMIMLLLTSLLAFADVTLDFTSANVYAAEAAGESERTGEKVTQVSENAEAGEGIDWNLVFLIGLSAISGATAAIYGIGKKK